MKPLVTFQPIFCPHFRLCTFSYSKRRANETILKIHTSSPHDHISFPNMTEYGRVPLCHEFFIVGWTILCLRELSHYDEIFSQSNNLIQALLTVHFNIQDLISTLTRIRVQFDYFLTYKFEKVKYRKGLSFLIYGFLIHCDSGEDFLTK